MAAERLQKAHGWTAPEGHTAGARAQGAGPAGAPAKGAYGRWAERPRKAHGRGAPAKGARLERLKVTRPERVRKAPGRPERLRKAHMAAAPERLPLIL